MDKFAGGDLLVGWLRAGWAGALREGLFPWLSTGSPEGKPIRATTGEQTHRKGEAHIPLKSERIRAWC